VVVVLHCSYLEGSRKLTQSLECSIDAFEEDAGGTYPVLTRDDLCRWSANEANHDEADDPKFTALILLVLWIVVVCIDRALEQFGFVVYLYLNAEH
jgi:hypothetical protein